MSANNPNEIWTVPPELEQPVPRRVRLTGMGIVYCVVALVCIAFGVHLTAKVCFDELHRGAASDSLTHRLTAEGRETEATVTRLWADLLGHAVSFEYTVDGRSYERSAFIASQHWQSLQVRSSLTIRYLPSDPHQAYPVTDLPNSQNHWSISLPIAGMILLLMLGFAATYLKPVLPQLRLLSRGTVAQGIITQCREGSRGRNRGYFLHYDFSLPDGTKCQGRVFHSQPMAEGASASVLYDHDQPGRNKLYPMSMVRLAAT